MRYIVRLKRWEEQDFKTVEVVAKSQQAAEDKAEKQTGFAFFAYGSEIKNCPENRMAEYIKSNGYRI